MVEKCWFICTKRGLCGLSASTAFMRENCLSFVLLLPLSPAQEKSIAWIRALEYFAGHWDVDSHRTIGVVFLIWYPVILYGLKLWWAQTRWRHTGLTAIGVQVSAYIETGQTFKKQENTGPLVSSHVGWGRLCWETVMPERGKGHVCPDRHGQLWKGLALMICA